MATIPDHHLREIVDSASFAETTVSNSHESATDVVLLLHLLWSRRRFLLKAAISGFIVFTIIALLIPKRYESTTLLMPPDDQSNSGMAMAAALAGKMSGGLTSLAGDVLGLKSSGDLFLGILRSRTVEDDLINKYDLRKIYRVREWADARRVLTENTGLSEDRKSGIITITVTDENPQRAAAMAQEYVMELNAVVSQLSTSSARRERIFLEQRLEQVKRDLEGAEKDFSEFSSKNGTIDIKEQGRAMLDAASGLQGQLIAAQSELEGLKQIYSDSNVRVRSLKARIAELQNQLDKLGGKVDAAGTTNPNDNDSLYPSIRKLPLLGVTYEDLYRKTMVEQAVYESLTQEYELAKVSEAREIPSVKVLDAADIPERKSFPPRFTIVMLGTFVCLGCASLWILASARWRQIDPQDARKRLIEDVFQTVNARMPWSSPNGSQIHAIVHNVWLRLALKSPIKDK